MFASSRVGAVLNTIGAVLAAATTVLSATVTSVSGTVPLPLLAGLVSAGFLLRAIGAAYAAGRGRWSMGWTPRVFSWLLFGVAAAALALAGSVFTFVGFGAFVVLDVMGGLVKREAREVQPQPARPKRNRWITIGMFGYLAVVALFHVLVGQYFSYGVLTTWTLLSLGFCVLALLVVRGPKAAEAWLRPPVDHRLHEKREAKVVDPQRARAEEVLRAFRSRGDAGPFLQLVREAAEAADLRDDDIRTLEERILRSFARAGTDREQDARAALDEVEAFLSLRSRSMEPSR